MAMNKTPSSHSGYFSELTASAGRQSNFLFPVRIKMTPNSSVRPLSDSKKNSTKMMQPVLIKDLFQTTHKDRQNSTLTSVSTQKKKARSQRLNQPYLNTQSCYRPKKNEVDEPTLFNIKSNGGSKVRRQLYQTLDSPQKFGLEIKENTTKMMKPTKLSLKNLDETINKNDETINKPRKSYLLPPNTIKNSFLGKSGSNLKTLAKQSVKGNTSNVNKNTKSASQKFETKQQTLKSKNTAVNLSKSYNSSSNSTDNQKQPLMIRDNFTKMSPTFNSKTPKNDLCFGLQKLSVNKVPHDSTGGVPNHNTTQEIVEFDFTKINKADQSGLLQLKPFLEQSLQTCENQASQLKQSLQICETQALQLKKAIDCINQIIMEKSKTEKAVVETNKNVESDDEIVQNTEAAEKCNLSYTISVSDENSSAVMSNKSFNSDDDRSAEKINLSYDINVSCANEKSVVSTQPKSEKKLPIPINILVTDAELNQESNEASLETARLSTIGEVSCELSCEIESKKDYSPRYSKTINYLQDESENKENVNDTANTIVPTPRTPKTRRRLTLTDDICNSQRRRSARLAAKSMSQSMLSESDKQDSFTLLENELNLVHNPPPSKSLPASPIKALLTPTLKQWDKKIERPLKEYMALKMNGTFLVTPDVKRFQSCLEPTDTPHSRRSLSRKIFLELCDLYAESPEHD